MAEAIARRITTQLGAHPSEAGESVALLRDYRPGAPIIRGRFFWDAERLYSILESDTPDHTLVLYIDPVGDRESHFEIGASPSGHLHTRVARRGRTGTKFDPSWECPDATVTVGNHGSTRQISLPFAALGSISPSAKGWKIGAAATPDFTLLRPAPLLIPLLFCP